MQSLFVPMRLSACVMVVLFLFAGNQAQASTKVELAMKDMAKAYKELLADLQQPKETDKPHYLDLAATIKKQAQTSHDLAPKLAETLPADQRDAMIQAYRKDMDQFVQTTDSLTQALQAGQWDEAKKVMATLKQDMVDGHKAYRAKH